MTETIENQVNNIYFDNAATTFPKPEAVWATMDSFARSGGANANRGQNPFAKRAARLVDDTRQKVAEWLGVPTQGYVTFTPSATIALNQVILGTSLPKEGSIYLSPFEHNSALRPATFLASTGKVKVKEIPFLSATLEVEWEKLEVLWRDNPPAMLVLSQASNVCGLLLPVEELAIVARQYNPSVVIVVDGSQAAGLYPLNLKSGLIDYLIWSGHKSFYGPFGVAGIGFCSERQPLPILFGGTGTFSESLQMPEELPSAFEAGSLNSPAIAGLNTAIGWLQQTGRDKITQHNSKLMALLEEELDVLPGLKMIKVKDTRRSPVLSFTIPGIAPQAIEEYLGNKGFGVRAGLHCSPWTHQFLDTLNRGGTVRLSPGYFNTETEVRQIREVLEILFD